MTISSVIDKYIDVILKDELHRYTSWDNCFQSFSQNQQSESHILELAFFLASWGMYRGSSGLLQKNHLIHKGAIEILFSSEAQKLKCNLTSDVNENYISEIISLKAKLANHYKTINFVKDDKEPELISTTDTLLSKILLGTLCCVPAYDRYFVLGLKEKNLKHTSFNEPSLIELFKFVNENKTEIEDVQSKIHSKLNRHYPVMKIIDMYFWQIGYDSIKNMQNIIQI